MRKHESRPKAALADDASTIPAEPDNASGLGQAALLYARAGWPVFPCNPGGKAPATVHGFHDATTNPDTVAEWWARNPDYNIGYRTGVLHDVLDVDVKTDGNGWEALYRLQAAGLLRGCVAMARTRNGGLHMFYPASGASGTQWTKHKLDFKAAGGYVIVAPSKVAADEGTDGTGCYKWEPGNVANGQPFDLVAAKAHLNPPKPQPARNIRNIRKTPASVDTLVDWVRNQPEGNRNNGLFWAACQAREAGLLNPGSTAADELIDAAVSAGLPLAEAHKAIKSACRRVSA